MFRITDEKSPDYGQEGKLVDEVPSPFDSDRDCLILDLPEGKRATFFRDQLEGDEQTPEAESLRLQLGLPKIMVKGVAVTPELATQWLDGSTYPAQRRLSPAWISFLAEEILGGRFVHGSQIHFAKVGEQLYLINGQHTLSAIVQSNKTIALAVVLTELESHDEIRPLYACHDHHRKRNRADTLRAYDFADQHNMPSAFLGAVGSALAFIRSDFSLTRRKKGHISPVLEAEEVREWLSPAKAFHMEALAEGSPFKRAIQRQGILSVALITVRDTQEKALEFWGPVAHDDPFERDDPRRLVRDHLLIAKSGGSSKYTTDPQNWYHPQQECRKIARCWNAFFNGRELKRVTSYGVENEVAISGTDVVIQASKQTP